MRADLLAGELVVDDHCDGWRRRWTRGEDGRWVCGAEMRMEVALVSAGSREVAAVVVAVSG